MRTMLAAHAPRRALIFGGLAPLALHLAAAAGRPALASPPPVGASAVAGPISVSASLNGDACTSADLSLTATVLDAYGTGVAGATVTGVVDDGTTTQSLSFPPTEANGSTTTEVRIDPPSPGTQVSFIIDASAGAYVAETQTSCSAG